MTIIHYGNKLTTALVGIDLMAGTIEKNMLITLSAPTRCAYAAVRPVPFTSTESQ